MSLSTVLIDLLTLLTPTGRELAHRRRRADAAATIAAERIEMARLLTGIAGCQLRHFELDCRSSSRHPDLRAGEADLREALNDIMRDEVYRFWKRTEEPC